MSRPDPCFHRRASAAAATLVAGLLAFGQPAGAADFRLAKAGTGETRIEMSGIIVPGDEAKMAALVATSPHPSGISLSSVGGNVQAALAIGTLVRHEGLKTIVPARTICASACGLVWLAGVSRAMGEDAHVGLHAAYLRKNGVAVETGAANALIGAYLDRLGFDDRAIVYLTGAAPDDMTWIRDADRQRYGIAFDAVGTAAVADAASLQDHPFLSRPIALAGAIAAAAVGVVDRIMGRPAPAAATNP